MTKKINARRIQLIQSPVISEGTTTDTVEAPITAEPGTTTDVQTIDHGDGTETTITTTVTVNRVRWERRLRGCIDPPEVFLAETPQHLLNARYCGVDGERVALVVFVLPLALAVLVVDARLRLHLRLFGFSISASALTPYSRISL